MSAYNRAELSVEAYLVRVLAALCRQSGGEVRVKGELIDLIGEATCLVKSWDSQTQELVITASKGMFTEVYRVIPEKQTPRVEQPALQVDPMTNVFRDAPAQHIPDEDGKGFLPKTSTIDNPRLAEMERQRRVAKAAAMLREELRERARERERIPT